MTDTSFWQPLAEFPTGLDLEPLRLRLINAGIGHRLARVGERQILWIEDPAQIPRVRVLLHQFSAALPPGDGAGQGPIAEGSFADVIRQTPVTAASLLLSIFGAMLVNWQFDLIHFFTFQDFQLVGASNIRFHSLQEAIDNGQYWRLITPIFLHFGLFHLAFNGLWLWVFGRPIELVFGSTHLLLLILVIGLSSNLCQYLWQGPSLFGGLSGVLYGLLGYRWIRNLVAPSPAMALPPGILGFMLLWLVLCMSGLVNLLTQASIANAAHVSGLLVGMVIGWLFGQTGRRRA